MKRVVYELTGRTFGMLTIECAAVDRRGRKAWLCTCRCGNQRIYGGHQLARGSFVSCGCRKKIGLHRTHSQSGTATHRAWMDMRRRCNSPKRADFRYYGGRGIKVCDRWNDFANFLADMGQRPEGMTLERIDNSVGYSPANCRWATRLDQARNIRTNHRLTLGELTLSMSEWSERLGFRRSTISSRLKRGWSVTRTLSTPLVIR